MSNSSITGNFRTVKQIYQRTQLDLYTISELINIAVKNDYSIDEPYSLYHSNVNSKFSGANHKISKANQLLEINLLLLEGVLDDTRLEYLMQFEKYQQRFFDLRMRLSQLQLTFDETDKHVLEVQFDTKLQQYNQEPTEIKSKEETDLFAGRSSTLTKDLESLGTNEKIMKTNESITSILQSTYTNMKTNVITSELIAETFAESSNSLVKLSDKYDFLSGTLVASKNLVVELQKADSADLRRMKQALAFFAVCCAWILWRRIIKYPVKLMIWILWKFVVLSFSFAGLFKQKQVDQAVTAVVESSTNNVSAIKNSTVEKALSEITNTLSHIIAETTAEIFNSIKDEL